MENKYYLAVETKPNNYFPVNLPDLSIFKVTTTNLNELDSLTLKYTKKEIMQAIEEANLLEINSNMALVVMYYEKEKTRKVKALTKDIDFDMWKNLSDNLSDKNYRNKVINFLNNLVSKEEIAKIKSAFDIKEFLVNISILPYQVIRKLYFYLYEN